MATQDASMSLADVISSLDPAKIPDKLHCPACDGFLLNGYKSPCCDQSICEKCYSEISDHCPICDHRPFTQELCRPNKAIRNTAKAYLKTQEKKLVDERAKAQATTAPASQAGRISGQGTAPGTTDITANGASNGALETEVPLSQNSTLATTQSSTQLGNDADQSRSESMGAEQATSTAQTELKEANPNIGTMASEDVAIRGPRTQEGAREDISSNPEEPLKDASNEGMAGMNPSNFQNMMNMNMGFNNNTDYNQMMQFMNSNGMNGFNPIMGMPNMGMNPMSQGMFSGFGGPGVGMNGMNGMNMGMNFPPNSGLYGAGWQGQNNNMWNGPQNNNPNAFSNGIGSDFGSNGYGYNMSQPGNFSQQQFPNGEFQNGYYGRGFGRGRGRGRGGYARGRGNFNQFSSVNQQPFQNPHEQQQYDIKSMQDQTVNDAAQESAMNGDSQLNYHEQDDALMQADDEFAPGGQEEVQEALGDDYHKTLDDDKKEQSVVPEPDNAVDGNESSLADAQNETESKVLVEDSRSTVEETEPDQSTLSTPPTNHDADTATEQTQQPNHHREEIRTAMPPPQAPLGPSAQYREQEDYGFRARGVGRYGSRGRSISEQNAPPVSPMKPVPQPSLISPIEPKGVGVLGAPTGPKAMREPPSRPVRPGGGSINGGFQIVGRASMASQNIQARVPERAKSATPDDSYNDHRSRGSSRRESRHSRHGSSRHEIDYQAEDDRENDRDRNRRKERRDEREDYEMQETDQNRSRSVSVDERKSSRRSHRDKDRHERSSKHHSSRSHRHREETNGIDEPVAADDQDSRVQSSRDNVETESRSSRRNHHSSKSSRYEDRDKNKDRERERDHEDRYRERDRQSDRDRDRDRDRKRSHHDRGDAEEEDEEEGSSRHRSRRHKREHREDEPSTKRENGSSRPHSHRSSAVATPVEPEKDPHTLEREARNRERMLKEQQRREKAMHAEQNSAPKRRDGRGSGLASGGRRVSYKYEDDLQSSMVEQEREAARYR